jgi:hypothetical protein
MKRDEVVGRIAKARLATRLFCPVGSRVSKGKAEVNVRFPPPGEEGGLAADGVGEERGVF